MDQIAHLTEASSDAGSDFSAADYQTLAITLSGSGAADCLPKRKGLSGPDHKTVDFITGQADIGHLVLLQADVNAVKSSDQNRTMRFYKIWKRLFPFFPREGCCGEQVLHAPFHAFLFHGDLKEKRIHFAE